jgi:hypothetical protein
MPILTLARLLDKRWREKHHRLPVVAQNHVLFGESKKYTHIMYSDAIEEAHPQPRKCAVAEFIREHKQLSSSFAVIL